MRRWYLLITAVALLAAAPRAFAQAPVIEAGGVQNTASNIALTAIAPQLLFTIKGQHLATSTEVSSRFPLPGTLGGATVAFSTPGGSLPARLIYASPTQIDAQAPDGIQLPYGVTSTSIVVTTAAGSSAPYLISLLVGTSPYLGTYPYLIAPLGIFTQDTSGCGQAVAYNVHPDGSVALNTPQNSLDPQKDVGLTIFLTGLGGLDFPDRQAGVPWTYNSRDNLASQLASSVTLGAPGLTATAGGMALTYLGPAPGKVGVDQINALGQWKGGPQGCKVPLSIALLYPQLVEDSFAATPAIFAPFSSSQLVDVSIQPGGGVCADPPDSTLGIVTFQTSTVSDVGGASANAAVTAEFVQSDGLGFPQPGPAATLFSPPVVNGAPDTQNNAVYGPFSVPQPACSASLPNTLDAGALTLSGAGLNPVALQRATQGGVLTYQATLPPGTLQGGVYQITGQGGSQVGAFTANANVPAPINSITGIDVSNGTTSLQPGTQLPPPCLVTGFFSFCHGGYNFNWTGGDDRSMVTIQFIVNNGVQAVASANGGDGQIFIASAYGVYPADCLIAGSACGLMASGNVEVIVTQTPHQGPSQPFSAPGLGWGGESTWKYVWDFRGLTNN